jgi:predicted RNA-binding Zn ribbon-like protein
MLDGMTRQDVTTGATLLGEPLPVELMNTVAVDGGEVRDALEDDAGAAAWLRAVADRIRDEAGVALGPLDGGDDDEGEAARRVGGELRRLRDALRRLAVEATHDPRPPATAPKLNRSDAIATVNSSARTWPELLWPADAEPSRAYRSAGGAAGELAVRLIARQGVELFAGSQRELLRPCTAPNCLLYFVKDHPRREWCSPACGNRARVARHYQRHRTARDTRA